MLKIASDDRPDEKTSKHRAKVLVYRGAIYLGHNLGCDFAWQTAARPVRLALALLALLHSSLWRPKLFKGYLATGLCD